MYKIQSTISQKITFSGIGLHSGQPVKITLLPEGPNKGISFLYNSKKIKALWKNAEISQLCTKIKKNELFISTIEHLMSALFGLGITNLTIKTNSSEIPILDGSAKDYIDHILKLGVKKQNTKNKVIKIKKKVSYQKENKFIGIYPNEDGKLIIDYSIDYKDEYIKKQKYIYVHSFENYQKIYLARTFCLHKDLEKIFAMGLAKGGTLDNAIVVSGNKILNQGGLRYKNEFVKHKVLDCIGDLYLSGYKINGNVICKEGGHEMNLMLLKEIFKNQDNYEIIDA